MSDPFMDDLLDFLTSPISDDWDEWYAEYGSQPSVVFREVSIPSCFDSLRFAAYQRGGPEEMYEFEERIFPRGRR